MMMKKLLFGMLVAPMAFGTNIALADGWPVSVVGSWSVLANQSPGTLSITSQGTTGDCQSIVGTIFGDSFAGFYCPHSGRVYFQRASGGIIIQDYTGNVSQAGSPLQMGGVFGSDLGAFGEYNFQASK
jgi:hypothetical protein